MIVSRYEQQGKRDEREGRGGKKRKGEGRVREGWRCWGWEKGAPNNPFPLTGTWEETRREREGENKRGVKYICGEEED